MPLTDDGGQSRNLHCAGTQVVGPMISLPPNGLPSVDDCVAGMNLTTITETRRAG
jgi:hypothetical protein